MKCLILLCLFAQTGFSHESIFDSVSLNPIFKSVNLTSGQQNKITAEVKEIKSSNKNDISGEAMLLSYQQTNLFAYSLRSKDQKTLYDDAWKQSTLNLIHSYYHYLQLTEQQKEAIIDTIEST